MESAFYAEASMSRRKLLLGAAAITALSFSRVFAQSTFPDRLIKLVVPLAPGGGGDIVARLIAAKLQAVLGQTVIVDNRAGGATVIGTDLVAKSPPDGYTLVLATSSHVINGSLIKLPFDPVKDFSGVCLIATSPLLLAVNPKKVPVKSLQELVALARSKPEGMTYGSSGLGSLPHLSGELLARTANVNLIHVPYKGSGPAEQDLLAGQIDMYFGSPSSLHPHVQTGALRLLASTGGKRSPAFADVPTLAETYSGFDAETFYALLAPANTPQAVLDKLNSAVRKVLEDPDVKAKLASLGAEVVGASPADTMKYIDTHVRQWDKLVKEAGIKVD
jgi:tripartite-type tricarboxylate transporter receptor subunit TctC